MTASFFPQPAPGFDDPLALLAACHGKILRYSGWLAALARNDVEPLTVAADIQRYFGTAGRDHHQDEERDLFPMLRRYGFEWPHHQLTMEHERLDALWALCAPSLPNLSATGRLAALEFAQLQATHVQFENAEVLPAAARLLQPADIALLGAQMALRRRVRVPGS